MPLRPAAWLLLGLALGPAGAMSSALAQDGGRVEPPAPTETGTDYASRCWRNGLRCSLVYGETDEAGEPAQRPVPRGDAPVISGLWAVAAVVVALVLALGFWMRFGGGGVLLSSRPRELRAQAAPESWRAAVADGTERLDQFLDRIAAMQDRRQALIQLLRRCLLHAAESTGTRLFRHDTERAVLARLPPDMPGRNRLEELLGETELVHYGGRTPAEPRFLALLDTARGVLSRGGPAHA